jgi:hypothetical protein
VRRLDDGGIYSGADALTEEDAWSEALEAHELAEVLRSAMSEGYADAGAGEMSDAVDAVLESMSPAEAFNFSSALNRIAKSANQLLSDPTFVQVAQTALPIAGTLVGGPAGAALGGLAANALSGRAAPPPAAAPRPAAALPPPSAAPAAPPELPSPAAPQPAPGAPTPGAGAMPPPGTATTPPPEPAAPAPASPVTKGSAAAAQALVLTQQPDILRSLLATALGQHGRQQVSGVPVAQVINLFSQVLGQAAADADELMYSQQRPESADTAEGILDDARADSVQSLYIDLLGTDNLELAEAAGWEGPDR